MGWCSLWYHRWVFRMLSLISVKDFLTFFLASHCQIMATAYGIAHFGRNWGLASYACAAGEFTAKEILYILFGPILKEFFTYVGPHALLLCLLSRPFYRVTLLFSSLCYCLRLRRLKRCGPKSQRRWRQSWNLLWSSMLQTKLHLCFFESSSCLRACHSTVEEMEAVFVALLPQSLTWIIFRILFQSLKLHLSSPVL